MTEYPALLDSKDLRAILELKEIRAFKEIRVIRVIKAKGTPALHQAPR
jgi:hypothetical protein